MHKFDFNNSTTVPYRTQYEIDCQEQRQKRFEAAKKIYNDLSWEHHLKFEAEKEKQQQKLSYMPKSKKELEERMQEIEDLKMHLRVQRKGIGTAQRNAEEENILKIQEGKYAEQEKARIAEIAKERYRVALEELHRNENVYTPNYSVKNAKEAANERQNYNLQRFINNKNAKKINTNEDQKNGGQNILVLKPTNRITSKTIKNSRWGQIPVNEDALRYQKQLEQSEKEHKLQEKQREQRYRNRTKAAAFRAKCEKICTDLQDDVNNIKKYEIDLQLTNENLKKPASEIPMYQTYLIDDHYQKRSEAVALFLSAPEAPKPRKNAPVPLPIHALPPSPVQSDEEEDDFIDSYSVQ
ncbi:hypothetical protein TRFO_41524 [Tritrichomonas foetus]|uniref:Uncharacterized protein n=1 Tax=Tritrichomonas foetus TaxID=1144522 RepID=A0A1J4L4K0_9EUKA|nr:hypothetical protein TRFO_41524 [Tritrichomonas foetus]|eukprot:OHT16861.1 hypothetical protein TRFO_41524 [Tritrichomonas foetus]